jgi:hypothetical protein
VSLKTKLEVRPEGEPSFTVKKRLRYPKGTQPAVGATIKVVYEPGDEKSVELAPAEPVAEKDVSEIAGTGLGSGGAAGPQSDEEIAAAALEWQRRMGGGG